MRRPENWLRLRSLFGRRAMDVSTAPSGSRGRAGAGKLLDDTGSSLVEFAVSASVLFLALFGIIEMCFALYIYDYVSDAARAGTRYAMVRGSSCTGLTNCDATPAQIQSYLRSLPYPGLSAASLTATVNWYPLNTGTVTGWGTTACSCPNPKNEVQVTVNYLFPLHVPYFPSGSINIRSTSQVVIAN
jgi:Flp pilus assembly protein TadG